MLFITVCINEENNVLLLRHKTCGEDEMRRGRKRVAVVVQRGLALLVHVLLEHVLVEDHLGDVLLEQGLVPPLLSSWETELLF